MIGMAASAGVAVTYGAIEIVMAAEEMLIPISIALCLAIGLEPVVSWMESRGTGAARQRITAQLGLCDLVDRRGLDIDDGKGCATSCGRIAPRSDPRRQEIPP